ncbi:hypothetical protein [Sphingobacterium hungaricum]|uniref:hypothetical protein n=1 Tax=Sphingobacterium hungaricum TaxID=2082723 RepID=UPI001E47D945|nr:hypothetical protein [Sphingobacterium hungaricum]
MIIEIDDLEVSFISVNDDFIKNKQATGRAKDLGDIESLQKLKKTQPNKGLPHPKKTPKK